MISLARLTALPGSLIACVFALLFTDCTASVLGNPAAGDAPADSPATINLDDGLIINITHSVLCTRKTKKADTVFVHYRGVLASNGQQFDSSYDRGEPFRFTLGLGQVIKGWDEGLQDMCIGEKRTLKIPPTLGYGDAGAGALIPGGATLVFDTELRGIFGVEPEAQPETGPITSETPTETAGLDPTETPDPSSMLLPTVTGEDEEAFATIATISPTVTPTFPAATAASSSDSPFSEHTAENDGECHLLGPFALIVQAALGLLALGSLVWKRYRERPRRPLLIWFFDASKQVLGSALLHLLNLAMSMLGSGSFDVQSTKTPVEAGVTSANGQQPNPCSFYLLNLAIDTTFGIPILVLLLRLLHHAFSLTPLAKPQGSLKSGYYGDPPHWSWYLKQSFIYFLGLLGMKFCVYVLFQMLPWLPWVGDWALKWTEGNTALQIVFVMFIFPLVMNAIQYYIVDSFIKEQPSDQSEEDESGGNGEPGEESEETGRLIVNNENAGEEEEDISDDEVTKGGASTPSRGRTIKEVNPMPLPAEDNR
ncbi:MAG: hypothetical protein M1821_004126 [Bathelium mastoideum]|nr:MAG: hypothetical protein M1821_004126 [Bathelium mastoideum]KAI9691196.1 MAG: hypothetical protein M1822_008816 [Bathelium mastoideum]